MTSGTARCSIFDRRYILVTNIACFIDPVGDVYINRLWHHDFVAHIEYLPNLRLVAPSMPKRSKVPDLVRLDAATFPRSHIIELPAQTSVLRALMTLPVTAFRMWKAVGYAQVVHAGVGGWPYPLGWLATFMAKIRRRSLLIVVESAPWREMGSDGRLRFIRWISKVTYELATLWSCRVANLCIYTHPGYRKAFPCGARGVETVAPATWINDGDVLDDAAAQRSWAGKPRDHAHFLFAGRLTANKGVQVLIDALHQLESSRIPVHVDAIGMGDLRDALSALRAEFQFVKFILHDPVPYGAAFFALLDHYHAVLVPSISDEQPRIFFDAAARAVPLIASDTEGLRFLVKDGTSGTIVLRGDVSALANVLAQMHSNPSNLYDHGMAALRDVRTMTHRAMHADRSRLLLRHLSGNTA